MTANLKMCSNVATSVNNAKTDVMFDVFEVGQVVGRIWTERSVDVKPGWQFKRVKDGACVGEPSELFDTNEDALAAFEKVFYEPSNV